LGAAQTKTKRTYFEDKKRVRSILTKAGGVTVQDLSYDYDDRLNLTRRTDALQGMTEYFERDKLDRLKCADFDPAPGCAEGYSYGPDGNIPHKPGFGPIAYDLQHPHAAVSGPGGPFQYDDVGNQIARAGATIEYTPFDLRERFTLDQGGAVELDYDGNQARIRKTTAEKETIYLGDLYERVTDTITGAVVHEFHVHSGERVVAVIKRQSWGPSSTRYVHVDHLGSVDVITNNAGTVVDQRSYDAFGARRNPIWSAPPPQGPFSSEASLGFTGHEEDDELGLVNMKGRLYDPQVGRFLTPDPVIGTPTFGQSWNPYSYVVNSPLSYVDPTGFTEEEPEKEILPIAVYEKFGPDGNPTEVHLIYPPRRPKPPAKEEPREPAEVGATTVPTDMRVWGNTAGHAPAPSPVAPSIPSDLTRRPTKRSGR
jgi:RHS repeat-associated protein